jgi:uncharacterized delta-60 repeat protein
MMYIKKGGMVKWIVVLVLLVSFSAQAQIVEWTHRYDGPDNLSERPYDIAADNSGNVYVGGFGYLTATYMDYLTIKYDSNGDTTWVRYYDGGDLFYDRVHAIAVDDSGNVYVAGLSIESGNQYDIATIKYNSAGVEQWVNRYDGPGNDDDEAYDIAVDDSGYIYVTGYTRLASNNMDIVTIKYDNAGDTVWTATYDGPYAGGGFDVGNALALDDSGNIYVAGYGHSLAPDYDYITIKYDAAGDTQWVTFYDGSDSPSDDQAVDIALGGGYIYVTGTAEGAGTYNDYATVKYSPAGDTLWEMVYDGPISDDDYGNAIAADDMGNVFVTGKSMGSVQMDYATIKYNFTGNIEWISRYDGPDNDIDEAVDVVVDDAGYVFVAGESYATQPSTPEFDFLTVQYNPSGVEQWTHRYNGTGDSQDHMHAMTIDDIGNVYVTGQSVGTNSNEDIVTIKYGVTGINEWSSHPAYDTPFNLSVSPNPFKHDTKIRYSILDNGYLIQNPSLAIFDASGRLVRCLIPASSIENQESEVFWDGTDQSNRQLPSGVYFIQLDTGDYQEVEQILLIR